jgi:hypothetical protein
MPPGTVPWDWNLVGELVVGISFGMGLGGFIASHFLESALWKLLSHPTVRKVASAAEKAASAGGGIIDTLFGKP